MIDSILIFTDGASKGNPGPGGWGVVGAYGEKVVELGGFEEKTTNNRMELRAAIEALSLVSTLHPLPSTLSIYSDSTYLVGGITTWIRGWKQNGWRTKQKKDVLNRDLWETLDELAGHFNIEWHKVAGHADTPGNARADEIASAFGEGLAPRLYVGSRDKYPIDISTIGTQTVSRSGKSHSYVSLVDGVVEIHKTWDECKKRVEGKSNVRYRKAMNSIEEATIIKEFKLQR